MACSWHHFFSAKFAVPRWCDTGRFLATIFNAISLYKKSIRVTWRLQRVAQLWTDFKFLQRCCNKLIVMLHVIDFSRNNVALKIVPCNITIKNSRQKWDKLLTFHATVKPFTSTINLLSKLYLMNPAFHATSEFKLGSSNLFVHFAWLNGGVEPPFHERWRKFRNDSLETTSKYSFAIAWLPHKHLVESQSPCKQICAPVRACTKKKFLSLFIWTGWPPHCIYRVYSNDIYMYEKLQLGNMRMKCCTVQACVYYSITSDLSLGDRPHLCVRPI